jgi:oligopeptide transport system ATP-binding protein
MANVGKKHKNIDYNTKILEVKNLKKYFYLGVGRNKLTIPAVDNLTFDIYKREVFGLVGESGCGKTTTGRTIIKLYNPTAGTVTLNNIKIGAGVSEHVEEIKRVKRKLKYDIIQFDEKKRQIYNINQVKKREIAELEHELAKQNFEYKNKKAAIEQPIIDYRKTKFKLGEKHKLDLENVKYTYNIAKGKIKKLRINQVETLYKNELAIEKNKYKNKLIGLKESAALVKEDKEQRISDLKIEYAEGLKALHDYFLPLIEDGKKAIISREEAKEKFRDIREKRRNSINKVNLQYKKDLKNLEEPNHEKINASLLELKENFETSKTEIKLKIEQAKEKAANLISEIPEDICTEEQQQERKTKVEELKLKAKEEIKELKAKIVAARRINKSKEALLMSQKMQMIFQDPISSLNPRMTVREIVGEGLIIGKKHTNEEITKRVEEVLELVGLSKDHAMRYPHEFSGGQRQRIGVARALIMEPNFIIADEPISALDVSIQAQVINLLQDLKKKLDLTILFIAHDLSVVRFFCDRIAVMYNGKIMELAESEELFRHPLHPYTKSLLSAIPVPDPDYEKDRKRLHYNPRMHDYRFDKPSLREIVEGHFVYVNDKEFEEMKKEYKEQEKERS